MRNVLMLVFGAILFIPQAHNGVRNWFTADDVVAWIDETQNVMPVYCTGENGVFTECTVVQAQPLTLTWDDNLGKVVAHE